MATTSRSCSQLGGNPNVQDNWGQNPLHAAIGAAAEGAFLVREITRVDTLIVTFYYLVCVYVCVGLQVLGNCGDAYRSWGGVYIGIVSWTQEMSRHSRYVNHVLHLIPILSSFNVVHLMVLPIRSLCHWNESALCMYIFICRQLRVHPP